MKFAPELRFVADTSLDAAERVDRLLASEKVRRDRHLIEESGTGTDMARRKKGRAVHGWVVLDKPSGMTSTQAVGAVRRIFDARKAGHSGTLDPLATGVLPIALGEATKTVPYAVEGRKRYRFTVRWGVATNTDDAEGTVIGKARTGQRGRRSRRCSARSQERSHRSRLRSRRSRLPEIAPMICRRRRSGHAAAQDGRSIFLEAGRFVLARYATFEAECGKGTYVRALARDMGSALGCLGHLIALRRTRVAGFSEADAISLEVWKRHPRGATACCRLA